MFLDVSGLTVDFGKTRALDHVSFSADAGSVVIITGNNGAGKSTLLWAVSGLLLPTSGRVEFPSSGTGLPSTSFLSHQNFLYEDLTVFENLLLTAQLHHLDAAETQSRNVLDRLEMGGLASKRISELSRGQIQRAAVARAILPSPKVLILDEPFSNLDAPAAKLISEIVESMKSPGRLILLATHDVEVCRRFSPRVVELSAGKIVKSG